MATAALESSAEQYQTSAILDIFSVTGTEIPSSRDQAMLQIHSATILCIVQCFWFVFNYSNISFSPFFIQ